MKTKIKLLFYAVLVLISNLSFGQNSTPNLNYAASTINDKEASSFQQVDLSTGVINPTLPLTSIACKNGGITHTVDLSYTKGQGVRVNDIASPVGLGWEMSAGASIVREVKDLPDEGVKGWLSTRAWPTNSSPQMTMGNIVEWSRTVPQASGALCTQLSTYLNSDLNGGSTFDQEPDVFVFSIGSKPVQKFVFDKDGNILLLPKSDIKIYYTTSNNLFSNWTIQLPDGNKYIFNCTNDRKESITTQTNNGEYPVPTITSKTYEYKWNVYRILSINKNYLEFSYSGIEEAYKKIHRTFSMLVNVSGQTFQSQGCSGNQDISITTIYNRKNYLTAISNELGEQIQFLRNGVGGTIYCAPGIYHECRWLDMPVHSADVPGQDNHFYPIYRVKKINMNGLPVQEYKFHYSFFNGNTIGATITDPADPGIANESNRLKLDKVVNITPGSTIASDKDYEYKFEYITNNSYYPHITTNNQNTDLQGFYNNGFGGVNGSLPCGGLSTPPGIPPCDPILDPNCSYSGGSGRKPNATYAEEFLIKKIILPTKGEIKYEFEGNTYFDGTVNKDFYGLRIRKISILSNVSDAIKIEYNYLKDETTSNSSGTISPIRRQHDGLSLYFDKFIGNNLTCVSGYNIILRSASHRETSEDLIRYSRIEVDKIYHDDIITQNGTIPKNGERVATTFTNFLDYPDLPLLEKSQINYNGCSRTIYTGDIDGGAGVALTNQSYKRGLPLTTKYYVKPPDQNPTNNTRIATSELTDYLESELATSYNFYSEPTANRVTCLRVNNGMRHYCSTASGVFIYNTEYYEHISERITPDISTEKKYAQNTSSLSVFSLDNSKSIQTEVKNLYNSDYSRLLETRSTNSDGTIYHTYYKYIDGLGLGTIFATNEVNAYLRLLQQNIGSKVIEIIKTQETPGNLEKVTGAELNTYIKLCNPNPNFDRIAAFRKYSILPNLNLDYSSFTSASVDAAGNLLKDLNYYIDEEYINSDLDQTPCGYKTTSIKNKYGDVNSVQYGYKESSLISAKFTGAAYKPGGIGNECSFLSFENLIQPVLADDREFDTWRVNQNNLLFDVDAAHTGEGFYKIGNATSFTDFAYSPGKHFTPNRQGIAYKFSAWLNCDDPAHLPSKVWLVIDVNHENGTELLDAGGNDVGYHYEEITLPSFNKWTYFEKTVDLNFLRGHYNTLISPTEKLDIVCYIVNYDTDPQRYIYTDDFRFSPVLSSVETFTYDLYGRITSKSHNNGIPAYFIYREDGSLKYTLDSDKNVRSYSDFGFKNVSVPGSNNYSKEIRVKSPMTIGTFENNLLSNSLTHSIIDETTSYNDGLGRTIQLVNRWSTVNERDLVSFNVYDNLGRQMTKYFTYEASSTDGNFKTNFLTEQYNFYQNGQAIAHSQKPYTKTEYSNSPSNRIWKTLKNPADISIAPATNSYTLNESNDVLIWKSNGNGANTNGYYLENTLYKTTICDEDGNCTIEFTDMTNNLICKTNIIKTIVDGSGVAATKDFTNGTLNDDPGLSYNTTVATTYYVYDDYGFLVYEIPPYAIELMASNYNFSESDVIFKELIFGYRYDSKGRVYQKKNPGQKDWTLFVFDEHDRIIMEQSPNQIAEGNGEWHVTKFDGAGRVVIKALNNYRNNQFDLQLLSDQPDDKYEIFTTEHGNVHMYSNRAFPILDFTMQILSVYYFDNYLFNSNGPSYVNPGGKSLCRNTAGLLTGKKAVVLHMVPEKWLTTVSYYDEKTRSLQTHVETFNNGWDIDDLEYDFTNKIIANTRKHTISGQNPITLNYTYTYDNSSRSQTKSLRINNGGDVVLAKNNYNAIGQLIRKQLHYSPTSNSGIQNIDYRYTINGKIQKINNSNLLYDSDNPDYNDVFGEDLFYSNSDINFTTGNGGATPLNYNNGNIRAMAWKTKIPGMANAIGNRRIYIYRYNQQNMMTAGYYISENNITPGLFDQSPGLYDETLTYDLNGNVLHLSRHADAGGIDELSYSYESQSNKLTGINDRQHITFQPNWDYHDINTNPIDFNYDANGNLLENLDKQINTSYNCFNLPENTIKGSDNLTYIYNGEGQKLAKQFNGGDIYYYCNGFEYLNNDLQMINHEDGRIRPPSAGYSSYSYDYFIKDHVENVRVVVTYVPSNIQYLASMEDQNQQYEERLFENIPETRTSKPSNAPLDPTYSPDEKVSLLNASSGKVNGHAKLLKMMEGESVDLDVKYFFDGEPFNNNSASPVADIITQFAQIAITNTSVTGGMSDEMMTEWVDQHVINNAVLSDFLNATYADLETTNNENSPRAYLVHLFFDKDFNLVTDASGLYQATNPDQLGELMTMNIKATKDGYMYIYVTNQSAKDVSFDNLQINHKGSIIIDINHYYPFGQLIEDICQHSTLNLPNNKKYCGKELETWLGLQMTDHGARMYDPLTARWGVQDPAYQFYNPYIAMGNNPVIYVDKDGRWVHIVIGAAVGGVVNLALHWNQLHSWQDGVIAFGIGAVAGGVGAATGGAAFGALGGAAGGAGGFIAGAGAGAIGSAASMPIQGLFNTAYFGDKFMSAKEYVSGILIGGVLGGTVQGISALRNGRSFWTGDLPDVVKAPVLGIKPIPTKIEEPTIATNDNKIKPYNSDFQEPTDISLPDKIYHYTDENPNTWTKLGKLPDSESFLTPNGELTSIQAKIELSMPNVPNFKIEISTLGNTDIDLSKIVFIRNVNGNVFNGGGGGWEILYKGQINLENTTILITPLR